MPKAPGHLKYVKGLVLDGAIAPKPRPKMQADHSFEVPLLVEVARNPQQRVAQDLALVLTARGIEAQIGLVESPKGPRWTLMVEAGDGPRARGELEAFRGENAAWRGPLVYVLSLIHI